jgi:UDPglucose 6-dehydrogenase
MKLVVVGTGYVGLVSGVCLAAKGHQVKCVDVNSEIVDRINKGTPHIYESGLPELLGRVLAEGRFAAARDLADALVGSELLLIAVGTPSEKGQIDLQFVCRVAGEIGSYLKNCDRHLSVVIKSTVIPGTTDTAVRHAIEAASGKLFPEFGLGMNPEFLREGTAVEDFMSPDRIVLGYEDRKTLARLEELYAPWDCDKLRVNSRTAEMIKYANNALLATQISAINELANLAAEIGGIDVMDVARGIHLDKRWSPILPTGRVQPDIITYLVPGCGFGGSCFPKDVQALRSQGERFGMRMSILNAVLDVNERQPGQVIVALKRHIGSLASRRCLLLGLAFKPDTDDVRESASLKIVNELIAERAEVVAHDPVAAENFRRALGSLSKQVHFVSRWQNEIDSAEIIIIATKWNEYRQLVEFDLAGKTVFDSRRLLTPGVLKDAAYLSIGLRTN